MRFSVRADQKLTVFVELEARSEISPESSVQAGTNEKRPAKIGPVGNRRLHPFLPQNPLGGPYQNIGGLPLPENPDFGTIPPLQTRIGALIRPRSWHNGS